MNSLSVGAAQAAWRDAYPDRSWASKAVGASRIRASAAGVPHAITPSDLLAILPTHCPITGSRLKFVSERRERGRSGGWSTSPTVDRLDPAKGYVLGNIAIVSMLANQAKKDRAFATVQEFGEWYHGRTAYADLLHQSREATTA